MQNQQKQGISAHKKEMQDTIHNMEYLLSLVKVELAILLKQFIVCYSLDKRFAVKCLKAFYKKLDLHKKSFDKSYSVFKTILKKK